MLTITIFPRTFHCTCSLSLPQTQSQSLTLAKPSHSPWRERTVLPPEDGKHNVSDIHLTFSFPLNMLSCPFFPSKHSVMKCWYLVLESKPTNAYEINLRKMRV